MTDLAFLGTGLMGFPMARNLQDAGLEVHAFNRSSERAEPLRDAGADVFEDPGDAAKGCSILVTMLSDSDAVLDLAPQALESLDDDGIWIQMSTIGINGTERCAQLAGKHEVTFVDAPVLGTKQPAEEGKLVVLASGPDSAQKTCAQVFDAVGGRTVWLGDAGEGSRAKVMINAWIVGVVGVLAETITLGEALGIDPQVFFDAVQDGPLDLPYAQMKGGAMLKRAFDDVSFRLALSRKDAELVLGAAAEAGLELPIMKATLSRLSAAEADGHGDEDMAATYWASAPQTAGTNRGHE
ncbi:MAG: NAD(P)-dependent oxidoreductase [Solirubrobacteraceae bacterium]